MKDKVIWYVYTTWYQSKCHDRKDIERIVDTIIKENPNETNYVKLGVKARRRCQSELN